MNAIFNRSLLSVFLAITTIQATCLQSAANPYALTISDISDPLLSGPVSTAQQGTTINIAPNILNLFPEIQQQGMPTTINLADYQEISLIGGTWDNVLTEWQRREQALAVPLQQPLPAFQTMGFGGLSWQAGQWTTGFEALSADLLSGITTPAATQGLFNPLFPQSSSSWTPSLAPTQTSGVYPWMSSYWTATPASHESQTGADASIIYLPASIPPAILSNE